jgi:hypothetical protein
MVTAKAALAALATLLALAFAAGTLDRYLARRKPHELAWTVSLVMFALASGGLWAGVATGWDTPTFRWFFLFGAIVNVPWLAVGTIYLLAGPRIGHKVAAGVALASTFAVGVMVTAPTRTAVPADDLPQGRLVFGILPRVLAAVASGVGALVVIGGALWSAGRLLRARRSAREAGGSAPGRRLAVGNVLIAVGTLILGASGTLSGRVGKQESFAITLAIGIAVLFAGFLTVTS